jgi:hypothetical protein
MISGKTVKFQQIGVMPRRFVLLFYGNHLQDHESGYQRCDDHKIRTGSLETHSSRHFHEDLAGRRHISIALALLVYDHPPAQCHARWLRHKHLTRAAALFHHAVAQPQFSMVSKPYRAGCWRTFRLHFAG